MNFKRNIWSSSFSFFMPKQLYLLFIAKNLKFCGKGLQQKSKSLKVEYIKIYPGIMINTLKLHHWGKIGDFIAKFEKVFVCWEYFWKPPPRVTSQNLGNFQEKYLRWVSVETLPLRFTETLLTLLKLMILRNFIMNYEVLLLILVFSQPYYISISNIHNMLCSCNQCQRKSYSCFY